MSEACKDNAIMCTLKFFFLCQKSKLKEEKVFEELKWEGGVCEKGQIKEIIGKEDWEGIKKKNMRRMG